MSVAARLGQAVVIAGIALAGSVALTGGAGATTPAVPYTDPDAVGSIGLCNQAGQQITSGSVTAQPFAWRAVSTQAAPSPYNNTGRTATLVAYQPQQGLPAGDWSGTQLTSSSRYSNPANPMAAATSADQTLQDIIEEYPPKWNGFLQLRIYLGTANEQAYDQHYPSLDIEVTGNTWQAVGGSAVNCASGTAESLESLLLPSTTTTAPPTTTPSVATPAESAGGAKGASSATEPESSDRSGSESPSGGTALAAGVSTADSTQSTNVPLVVGVGIAVLAVLAAATILIVRRRSQASQAAHPATSSADDSSTKSSSTKGDAP